MNHTLHRAVWLALTVTAPTVAFADDGRCAALVAAALDDVTIERATFQPEGQPVEGANVANPSDPANPVAASGLPSFCRVIGSARPEAGSDVRFEVWLPSDSWTGRFTSGNNGGLAGYISYDDLVAAVAAGHAGASTDTGHVSSVLTDSAWAKGHPERVRDYGWRGIHVTTVVAKKLIAAYYGRAPDHSYFIGCSNGGRQGLMEAWRFPEDYDGIIAGAPVASFTALTAAFISTLQAQLPAGAALRPDQMPLLQSEAVKQCDALDGQADGLVAAPLSCELDVAPLSCGADNTPQCFTPPQLAALTQIVEGRRDCHQYIAPARFRPAGAEAGPRGWGGWLAADQAGPTPHATLARGLLQDLMQEPTATPETFDFDRDQQALEDALGPDLDVEPRLRPFFERGGKLILWQGWADAAVSTELTLAFHSELTRNAGSLAEDALRLFMVPGVQHCGFGTGPDLLGQVGAPRPGSAPERNLGAALEAWVETGRAPNSVIGGFSSDAATGRERLVCAFPKRAELQAGKDPDRGESYACQD
jgi:feruloyl esterase